MTVRLFIVDSFSSRPFAGNPAGVCLLESPASEEWMRTVGAELDFPATAFVSAAGKNAFDLRWFTASTELSLCGHGTLAAAHVLWDSGTADGGTPIRFVTRGGDLRAEQGRDGWIGLDFPALPPRSTRAPQALLDALRGHVPSSVARNDLDFLVELATEEDVRAAQPDLDLLRQVEARGLILTAPARDGESRYNIVSRFFAPATGIPEDSVTGSAHCALAPYWMARLDRPRLLSYQASARGGYLRVSQPEPDRVRIEGQATTVACGELALVARDMAT